MQGHFGVETHTAEYGSVLNLRGELDLASSPTLEEHLTRAIDSSTELVIVDLRGLDFMDSTGLNTLVKGHQRAQQAGKRLGLVRGGPQVARLLSLTGIAERLTVVDAPEELLSVG